MKPRQHHDDRYYMKQERDIYITISASWSRPILQTFLCLSDIAIINSFLDPKFSRVLDSDLLLLVVIHAESVPCLHCI